MTHVSVRHVGMVAIADVVQPGIPAAAARVRPWRGAWPRAANHSVADHGCGQEEGEEEETATEDFSLPTELASARSFNLVRDLTCPSHMFGRCH